MTPAQYGRSRLLELLEARHMTQAEFAAKMDVSEAHISRIINGKGHFSFIGAKRASIILKCSMDDLEEWST